MKTILNMLLLLGLSGSGLWAQPDKLHPDKELPNQQTPSVADNSCGSQWHWLFKERGAATVPDGMQPVVVSASKYGANHCLMGRIQVKGGKLVFPLFLEKEDGTLLEVQTRPTRTPLTADPGLLAITNGCSDRFESADGEQIELFFYHSLNPRPTAFKRAPPAADFQ
jgi:hypothetical protein